MPAFPSGPSWPIVSYRFDINDATASGSPADFRDALQRARRLPPCPELKHMEMAETECHGWGGFGDADDALFVEPYVVLLRRSFIKRIPSTTLRAMVDAECRRWREERGVERVPAAIKKEKKEQVQESLLRATIPSVRQIGVFIDQKASRFYVLANGSGIDGIEKQVRLLLQDAYGGRVTVRAVGFAAEVGAMFPSQSLPASLSRDFMRYLTSKWTQTLRVGDVSPFTIELPEQIDMAVEGHGRMSASGENEAERLLEERGGEDDTVIRRATFNVRDDLGEWTFKVGGDGTLLRATMPRSGETSEVASEAFVRAALCVRAQQMLEALVHAFVVEEVEPQMDRLAQYPLFVSNIAGLAAHVEWTQAVEQVEGEEAAKPVRPPPSSLFGPIVVPRHVEHELEKEWLAEKNAADDDDDVPADVAPPPVSTDVALRAAEDMYEQALAVVATTQRASASVLQRMLKIGYSPAGSLLDLMEARGVIGPARGSQPREVFIKAAAPTAAEENAPEPVHAVGLPVDEEADRRMEQLIAERDGARQAVDMLVGSGLTPQEVLDQLVQHQASLEEPPAATTPNEVDTPTYTWDAPGEPPAMPGPKGVVSPSQWAQAIAAVRKVEPDQVSPGWLSRLTPVSRDKAKVIIAAMRERGLLPAEPPGDA